MPQEKEELLAYTSMRIHLLNHYFGGVWRIDASYPEWLKKAQYIYMRIIYGLIFFYTVQQAIRAYELRNDRDNLIGCLCLLITYFDYGYKQMIFWFRADRIDELLDDLKTPLMNQKDPKHTEILKTYKKHARLVLLGYNCAALCTCFLWSVIAMVDYLKNGFDMTFSCWMPFRPYTKHWHFIAAQLYIYIQNSWVGITNTTNDLFISTFLGQSQCQLAIIRTNLESLVAKCKKESEETGNSYADILNYRFKKILDHCDFVTRYVERVESIFGGTVFFQFLASGWIICTAGYRAVMAPSFMSVEFLSMLFYIGCMSTQLFVYCYYGNLVTVESRLLLDSGYLSNWMDMPPNFRINVIIFMERCKRPLAPMASAGVSIPLSLATFVSIMRTSYSYFAFLKNSS